MHKKVKKNILIGLGVAAVFGAGFAAGSFLQPQDLDWGPVRSRNSNYTFIHPLLGIRSAETNFQEFEPLKDRLSEYLAQAVKARDIDQASVYLRNLETAHWAGISENELYYPASMFKVPIMVAYFRQAESKREILDKKLLFTGGVADPETEFTAEPSTLVPGQSYTVSDLIERMIVKSDNFAKDMLLHNLEPDALIDILSDLGLQIPSDGNYRISAKTYSLFYRTLYGATLLNREMSERALELLSRTEFKNGVVGGVPQEVPVAHKYGERVIYEKGVKKALELHDCGIIYAPEDPYVLCVMTTGYDLANSQEVIRNISRIAYEEVRKISK